MAASLSRPDPSSPASVAEAGFSTSRRGFSQDEVRAFLTSVAAELGRLQERERQLEAQLDEARREVAVTPELDDETVASLLGEETLRVLHTARESASQIKVRAEEAAAKTLRDANDEGNRLRQEAEVEAARKRHDAASDAEAEVALAKQQGREMVNEARAYRERVLADLDRRTQLARRQIEELVNGRDRLLQVFERARLVAVDVTSELQAIDGPDELVNLSPTTGPVPIMVPTHAAPIEPDAAASKPESSLAGLADVDAADLVDIDDATDARDFAAAEPGELDDDSAAAQSSSDVDHADDTDVDDNEVDDNEVDDTEIDGIEADDTEAEVDQTDADAADEDVVEEAPEPTPVRDANVVSLFRGREPVVDDDADDHDDHDDIIDTSDIETADIDDADSDDGSELDKPDVNGIFERLRREAPAVETAGEPADEPAVESADDVLVEATVLGEGDAEPPEIVETPFTRRDEALVPLITGGARKLKRVLADEQNGVLDLLRQKEPVTHIDDVIADTDEHQQTYVDALADDLLEAAVAGAGEIGVNDTKTLRAKLGRAAAQTSARMAITDDLVAPLRERLERAIAAGQGDNEDITKRVRAVYREWKTQHIDDQLDDVFRFAYGGGIAAAAKPGTELVWVLDPSEPACPDCEDNSLGGPVEVGQPYPTGHTAAPAHPGCRCLTVLADQ